MKYLLKLILNWVLIMFYWMAKSDFLMGRDRQSCCWIGKFGVVGGQEKLGFTVCSGAVEVIAWLGIEL